MKIKTIALIILSFCGLEAYANFEYNIFNKLKTPYLEDQVEFQKIKLHTKSSPLSELKETSEAAEFWEKIRDNNLSELSSELAMNKIVGLSTGVIDVTYQVKQGAKAAIRETFGGYAEYQRRKQVEEIVNSSFHNRKQINDLIIKNGQATQVGSNFWKDIFENIFKRSLSRDKSYHYRIIKRVNNNEATKKIKELIKGIATSLLLLLIIIKVLFEIKEGKSFELSFSKPLLIAVLAIIAIISGDFFFEINLELLNRISNASYFLLNDFQVNDFDFGENLKLNEAWTSYADNFGYFPTMILAIFDIISQLFISCFYIALIAFVLFGLIFYPFWIIFSIFSPSQFNALSSYLDWLKANFALVFSPVLIIIFKIIAKELGDEHIFMSLIAKTLSFYSTPLLSYFIFLKADPIIKQYLE